MFFAFYEIKIDTKSLRACGVVKSNSSEFFLFNFKRDSPSLNGRFVVAFHSKLRPWLQRMNRPIHAYYEMHNIICRMFDFLRLKALLVRLRPFGK